MRVIVSNALADHNRGGCAITIATLRLLRQALPGCTFTLLPVIDGDPARLFRYTRAEFPDAAVMAPLVMPRRGPFSGMRALMRSLVLLLRAAGSRNPGIREIAQADLVVCKGGQTFRDRDSLGGVLGFWLTMLPLLVAHRLGKPAIALGHQVGPFQHRASRIVGGFVLRKLDLVVVRDPVSYDEALRRGVAAERLHLLPDLVFSFEPPTTAAISGQVGAHGLRNTKFAFLTTGGLTEESRSELAQLCRLLLDGEQPFVERLVLGVQTHDVTSSVPSSDLVAARGLAADLDDDRVSVVVMDGSPDEVMALQAGAACTIGGRVHSAIMSAIAGVPAFPLGSTKSKSIFWGLGMIDWVLPHPAVGNRGVALHIAKRADDPASRPYIGGVVAEQRAALTRLPSLIRDVTGSDQA